MERTSKGWLDYETGATPMPVKRRPKTAPAVLDGEDSLWAGLTPAARKADPETSNEGIHDVLPRAGSQQYRLLLVFEAHPMGRTAEEAGREAELLHTGYWKRVSDLLKASLLEDTLTERMSSAGSAQRVLAITGKGKAALAKRRHQWLR